MKLAQHKLSRRMKFRGLDVSIETDEGELRHWYDPHNEEKGTTKMKFPYGYIRRTQGVDRDHIDVYVGPYKSATNVFIVHQMKAPKFEKYDEDKCMIGFRSAAEAKAAYLSHYNDDRFFGSMTVMPFEEFKEKVLHSFELKRPHKIAGTPLRLMHQLERDFGKDFARKFFEETTAAFKGKTPWKPMTGVITPSGVQRLPIPPPIPGRVVTASDKLAATPAQMLNRKLLLYPSLPDWIMGHEMPKTKLEELAEALLPEKEPEPEPEKVPPTYVYNADERPTKPENKEAAMKHHLQTAYTLGGRCAAHRFEKDSGLLAEFDPAKTNRTRVLRSKLSADAQITGAKGTLLKSKTMTLTPPTMPSTSSLPKTPALTNVMKKLSQESVSRYKAVVDKAIKEAQNLGDPNFWSGGTPAEGEMAPPPTAEEAVKQLPLGTFQGMTTKVTPEGERSTSVNVTPDALAMPDIVQSIFAAEPGAKVEVKVPEQPETGGEELVPPGMGGGGPAAPPPPEGMA